MKPILLVATVVTLFVARTSSAQDSPPGEPAGGAAKKSGETAAAPEELESKFKTTLTKAVLQGRWCSIKEGVLGPEREDKYSIIGVTKLDGDAWLINARIEYNNKEIVAPIPVRVKWAGDTPVLIVDKIPVPGGGVYSARVLIYEQTYAGTWSGGRYAGLLNGTIKNETAAEKPSEKVND